VAGLLAAAMAAIKAAGSAEDVLWAIWDGSGLAEQWPRVSAGAARPERPAVSGPGHGACPVRLGRALRRHDTAGRAWPVRGRLGGQEIVGDTKGERAVRDDCVRILTALN